MQVFIVNVWAPRPADLTKRLTAAGFYETPPEKGTGSGYAVVVPLHEDETLDDAVARTCQTLALPTPTMIAWCDPFDLSHLIAKPQAEA